MTEIYGTLGPACADSKTLKQMFDLGMTGMRLNLSHMSLVQAEHMISLMRQAGGDSAKLLIDLQGPEVRIGPMQEPVFLEDGQTAVPGKDFPVSADILKEIRDGDEILLDDGKILLRACGSGTSFLNALVVRGGMLSSRKSLAVPGKTFRLPTLTEADRENLKQAERYGVYGVMLPFVRSADDLISLRKTLRELNLPDIRIFAKIENRDGVRMIDELIPEADEIVIARGDLGNAYPLWELPAVQKYLSRRCREAGRPFMVVTQMLASMENSPVPTRAEVSDIYNAVLDGASSVMVTGETAAGKYPAEVIRYLVNTVHQEEYNEKNA
ncbi:MAG: pyruvate kinase [Solobacterium sp.]|nr:pyruvate kinase [Solobacterium sp.]